MLRRSPVSLIFFTPQGVYDHNTGILWANSSDIGGCLWAPDEGGKDVFVHHTGISGSGFKSLAEGAKVEFEVRDGAKGPEATDVVLTSA